MTSTAPTRANVAPWMEKLPAGAREAAARARRIAAQEAAWLTYLSPEERAQLARKERDEQAAEARRELMAGRAAQRWAMWCHQVPGRYVDPRANCDVREPRTFEFWLDRPTVQHPAKIAAWLRSDSPTLILVGDTGTYKTGTALAAGYAAAAAAVHALYTSQLDYLRQLRPGGCDDPMALRARYAGTSLLVLDDLAAETEVATEFVRQEMCALLDERLRENRRQIVTCNVDDPGVLADVFGDRIMSRLRGGAVVLPFDGGDRRELAREPW